MAGTILADLSLAHECMAGNFYWSYLIFVCVGALLYEVYALHRHILEWLFEICSAQPPVMKSGVPPIPKPNVF